ncbi:MAG: nucleotidyltransferase [Lachnospiraceae bacterium]
MEKPVLVIMAAGMGSRYGGLKQIDPIDAQGHIIMDFSIYDAMEAGFEKVIFIIKKANEAAFKESIGNRVSKKIEVEYVYQELDKIPTGYQVPEGREKPFGTGHAILCCKNMLHGPFAVINADDYYGKHAYKAIYDYLTSHKDNEKYRYTMVGYALKNTLTEHGHVARGICETDKEGFLKKISERTHIEKQGDKALYTEDDGATWTEIAMDSTVSMNIWGFSNSILEELEIGFETFMREELPVNPLKAEYFLPFAVDRLLQEGKASVQILNSQDKWYGVTYKEDKEMVVNAIANLKKQGLYPEEF